MKKCPRRGKSKCKGPGAAACLMSAKNSKDTSEVRVVTEGQAHMSEKSHCSAWSKAATLTHHWLDEGCREAVRIISQLQPEQLK